MFHLIQKLEKRRQHKLALRRTLALAHLMAENSSEPREAYREMWEALDTAFPAA